ncbi:MAG TPA: hypothetical protein VFX59_26000 [Polyangiales bacterium]|nr:hypothetical protein [Polyangiales bacterium]
MTALYSAQRAFVATMFEVLGRLIVAGSGDPVVQGELPGFPEGYTIGFSVYGDTLGFRVARRGDRFVPAERKGQADLELVFKHVSHAFALASFQESSAVAYANDRFVSHGDIALSMRFMRCMDRIQAVMLPPPISTMALKSVPVIPAAERIRSAAGTVRDLIRGLIPGSAA